MLCLIGRKHMCNIARDGKSKTCFQIWHEDWHNGEDISGQLLARHRVQDRRPGAQSKRNHRRRVNMAEGVDEETQQGEQGADDVLSVDEEADQESG
ncbi:hypothetical protein BBJ28_00010589 [Nothophytophthora sp. Chile5]|nr:hypothetical protein BBJ28_00010589 [Nothophytophthora sp. Chile5]